MQNHEAINRIIVAVGSEFLLTVEAIKCEGPRDRYLNDARYCAMVIIKDRYAMPNPHVAKFFPICCRTSFRDLSKGKHRHYPEFRARIERIRKELGFK